MGFVKKKYMTFDEWRDEEIIKLNHQNDLLRGQLLNAKDSIDGIRKQTISDCAMIAEKIQGCGLNHCDAGRIATAIRELEKK